MFKRFFIALFVILPVLLSAQQKDPILFEVEGNPVSVTEFDYIYNKNNSQNANYSRESLEEYLDLYTKFKLKVQRAHDMKLDTIVSLQDELEGYQRQLANSYLMDKEVKDKLIKEAAERMQTDVEFSHIFIKVPPRADTTAFYKKATRVKELLSKGQDFANVAARMSDDKYSAKNAGYAGWINGMMPDGFYTLENALYNSKPGDITGPVRSKNGYHIVKTLNTRPNPGEYEIAHIKVNIEKGKEKENKEKIREIHTKLQEKIPFAQLARQYSADANSARSGGKIGYVGVKNPYDKHISNAIFELKKPGDYTEPLKTEKSWHIIKLLSIKPLASIEKTRPELESKILKNERYNLVKSTMIQRLKAENHFEYDEAKLNEFTESLDSDFFTFKWKPQLDKKKTQLMSFGKGKQTYTMNDFMSFLRKNSRDRSRMARSTSIPIAVQKLFTKFADEKTLKYEQKNLEMKYPEFRALMREYEEGILLFEATKINVWDKASSDSTGLANFFAGNKNNYRWPDKADIKTYAVKTIDPKLIKKISKTAARKGEEVVKEKFGSPDLEMLISSKTIDRDEDSEQLYIWKKRSISNPQVDEKINTTIFTVVEKVTPARNKTLDEARGFVIADYQDYLEKEWVKVLRSQYKVKVYQDVFESLIK